VLRTAIKETYRCR